MLWWSFFCSPFSPDSSSPLFGQAAEGEEEVPRTEAPLKASCSRAKHLSCLALEDSFVPRVVRNCDTRERCERELQVALAALLPTDVKKRDMSRDASKMFFKSLDGGQKPCGSKRENSEELQNCYMEFLQKRMAWELELEEYVRVPYAVSVTLSDLGQASLSVMRDLAEFVADPELEQFRIWKAQTIEMKFRDFAVNKGLQLIESVRRWRSDNASSTTNGKTNLMLAERYLPWLNYQLAEILELPEIRSGVANLAWRASLSQDGKELVGNLTRGASQEEASAILGGKVRRRNL